MGRRCWPGRALLLGLAAVLIAGCTGAPAVTAVDTPVPIASLDSVTGKWTGRIVKSPVGPQEEWVDLTIERDGTYRFTAFRTYSMLDGSGKLTVAAGELRSETATGTTTYRLYDRAGRRVLKVESRAKTGAYYLAELTPR